MSLPLLKNGIPKTGAPTIFWLLTAKIALKYPKKQGLALKNFKKTIGLIFKKIKKSSNSLSANIYFLSTGTQRNFEINYTKSKKGFYL
ncbi:hypothetical protein [Ascidiimonas aurantiaca]|uniref:hypothetical protein n=1 Tax=Ascidiimonas aurantiaca TaxID=1685432 RepID=UPI0030EE024C